MPKKRYFLIVIAIVFLLAGCASQHEVTGKLLFTNGDPAINYKIRLCLNNEGDGICERSKDLFYATTTGNTGEFTFTDVADGHYYILYSLPDSPDELIPVLDLMGSPIYFEMKGGNPIKLEDLIIRTSWAI